MFISDAFVDLVGLRFDFEPPAVFLGMGSSAFTLLPNVSVEDGEVNIAM